MSPLDLTLHLVTAPVARLEDVVSTAVAGGVSLVQVRDKHATSAQRAAIALRLARRVDVPVIVNDDLVAARAVDGVHVGPDDTGPVLARAELGPDAIVGWSLHDPAQLGDAAALAACTYVAVSPLWATPTKPDHTQPWGLEGLRRVVAALDGRVPVVAIGGIDVANAASVVAAGAAGVAVVSAICHAPDPGAAAVALRGAVTL